MTRSEWKRARRWLVRFLAAETVLVAIFGWCCSSMLTCEEPEPLVVIRDVPVEVTVAPEEAGRSRVALRPYRTFTEVEQPESEFILRLDDEGRVGLIEADGGAWKMTAKASIAAYFETMLKEEVQSGSVVVML